MHACDMHAHRDITRFAYDANHVTLMSPAFAFDLCQVEISGHDIVGVCVVVTPHHRVSHRMGMM